MQQSETLKVGDRIADITLPDLDGNPVALGSLDGKKYILFMWASW
ncbi:MAG: redoxin domain-containing protein [Caldilineaceae bacterium]|nr:redoxin domain-containing protein [Caldilineaceae bacterium]